MIQVFYDKLAIPETCHLGKRVFKKLFHENTQLGLTDKKAFVEDIDTVKWQYALKPNTIAIQPYEDDQREYHEIAILQVDLKTLNRTGRIAEVLHRAIPYPLVVVFAFEGACAVSLAHKRFSQAEKGAIVAEDFLTTHWIDLTTPKPNQRSFLGDIAISGLPQTHFFALYSAFAERVMALNCARLTGKYRVESAIEGYEQRRHRLTRCHELEARLVELKSSIKAETQFNRQVDLNTKIKTLENQLRQEAACL